MIGFYDYTVILTYAGALAGLLGISMSIHGLYINAILCMAVALVCDTLDGIVARKKKNRTKDEMAYAPPPCFTCWECAEFLTLPCWGPTACAA